ncbi:alcohol dehydrogenase [Enterobacterales bacterium CwR94]|nr:alcohol dehydrogenase [Enterobacterales bacterium CwR94]
MTTSQLIGNRRVISGRGALHQLPLLLNEDPQSTLLLCNPSFLRGSQWAALEPVLSPLLTGQECVRHEASPAEIDAWVNRWRGKVSRVVAIGGGSVLDAAKAVAALCMHPLPCVRYLEKVGDTKVTGATLPVIAVPTTAGTGSEATQNAVITDQGEIQVKASLRHENFVPAIAILDPDLLKGTPAAVLANCAIDAFTHLFESFLSNKANFFTRESSLQGLRLFFQAWPHLHRDDGQGDAAREAMLMASWLGGQTLGVAGLGVIHGIAGELGALKPWHHGEVCGRLLLPFLTLLDESAHSQQQLLLALLADALFPAQSGQPAQLLHDWIKRHAIYPFWENAPSLRSEEMDWILARSNSKNSWVTYSQAQQRALLTAAWPVHDSQ